MSLETKGNPQLQAMGLIVQLEGKVREKNLTIECLSEKKYEVINLLNKLCDEIGVGSSTADESRWIVASEMVHDLKETNTRYMNQVIRYAHQLNVNLQNYAGIGIEQAINNLKEECSDWRRKYILLWMLGYRNPVPFGLGAVLGSIITYMIARLR